MEPKGSLPLIQVIVTCTICW